MLDVIDRNGKILDKFLKHYFKKQLYSQLVPPMKYGVLFGGKKIPELMRGLGKGISEFKKGKNEIEKDTKE